ncbi:MAG: alpha/beta fold hydrolase, partial [Pseudomonadota bacterium]
MDGNAAPHMMDEPSSRTNAAWDGDRFSPFGPFIGNIGFLDELRHHLPERLDHELHAAVAKATGGFSPISFIGSYLDWGAHLMFAPGKQLQIGLNAWDKIYRLTSYMHCLLGAGAQREVCVEPSKYDKRFQDPAWSEFPFNLMNQQFLLAQQWWHDVFTGVPGVRPQHEALVDFTSRQFLDMMAPSNFFFTNPEVIQKTVETRGENLFQGTLYFGDDYGRWLSDRPQVGLSQFKVGENMATTEGQVIFQNHLVELIQYTPTTDKVDKEPILIIPAWIMKYYILDLTPENSLVRYLVDQGHTVLIVSWRNPTKEDRDLGLQDYLQLGVFDVLNAVEHLFPDTQTHLVGYCLGGTLAAIASAVLAREEGTSLQSLTLLAAQVDFEKAGELALFISESQLAFLDDLMWQQGVLEKHQMGGAFQILRSNDLIWSRAL